MTQNQNGNNFIGNNVIIPPRENSSEILASLNEIRALVLHNNPNADADTLSVISRKYPFGFGIFYYDGNETFHVVKNLDSDVRFDPTTIRVQSITKEYIAVDGFELKIKSRGIQMGDTTIAVNGDPGTVKKIIQIDSPDNKHAVTAYVESLGIAGGQAAWVIGLRLITIAGR